MSRAVVSITQCSNHDLVLGIERPCILADCCILCGECATNCPAGALRRENARMVLDDKACIGCHCCAEVCKVHAIEMQRPFLGRALRRAFRLVVRKRRQ